MGRPHTQEALRRWLAVALAAILLTLGSACGSDSGDTDGGTAAPASESEESASGPSDDDFDVAVQDEGAEPRSRMRLALKEGDQFRSALTMRMGIEMSIDGQKGPETPVPPMRLVMAGTIDAVDDDGATFSFLYEDVAVIADPGTDPNVMAQMNAGFAQLEGLKGSATVTDRGNTSNAAIDTAGVSDPNMKAMLDSFTSQVAAMTVPFPEQPVGVGAIWSAMRRVVLNGITTDTTTTYKLRKRSGDTYELDIDQRVTAPAGPAAIPGLPPGTTAEIVSYDATNTGTMAGSLKTLLPSDSALTGTGDIEMRVAEGGQTAKLTQKLTLDIRLGPA